MLDEVIEMLISLKARQGKFAQSSGEVLGELKRDPHDDDVLYGMLACLRLAACLRDKTM